MDVTVDVCCFMLTTISRVRISHTRTSPSSPPLTRNLWLCETARAVHPSLCASLIAHSISPVSASCARIWPSSQPVKTTSPVKSRHLGMPHMRVWIRPVALTP